MFNLAEVNWYPICDRFSSRTWLHDDRSACVSYFLRGEMFNVCLQVNRNIQEELLRQGCDPAGFWNTIHA